MKLKARKEVLLCFFHQVIHVMFIFDFLAPVSHFSFFFFLVVLVLELRVYTLNHSTCPFLWLVFSRQGLKLFAQAGFEL
jgi:hypothetical protein